MLQFRRDGPLAASERVAFVILTDGQENASREHTRGSIHKLLAGRQEDKNWLVLYLGASPEAFQAAGSLGISAGYALRYDAGNEADALRSVDMSIKRYVSASSASAGRLKAAFTDDERANASPSGDKAKQS
jgi:hypothetical protein